MVHIQGETIFNSWKDLFSGAGAPFPAPPKIYSFDGRNVLTDYSWFVLSVTFVLFVILMSDSIKNDLMSRPQKLVWHGADRLGVRNSDAYCDAWNSNSINKHYVLYEHMFVLPSFAFHSLFMCIALESSKSCETMLVGFGHKSLFSFALHRSLASLSSLHLTPELHLMRLLCMLH